MQTYLYAKSLIFLTYDVMSEIDLMLCIKIDKLLVFTYFLMISNDV